MPLPSRPEADPVPLQVARPSLEGSGLHEYSPPIALPIKQSWVLFVPALIVLGLTVRSAWVAEDAYITLRTIDNWFHGEGLRWNIGERVQAYTHPLWMLALSAVYSVLRDGFAAAALLGLVTTTAALLVLVRLARSTSHAFAALLLLAFSRAFIDFSTSGLENPLSHLLIGVFCLCYAVRNDALWRLSSIAGLIALNRTDAVLLVAPALAHVTYLELRARGVRQTARELALGLSPWFAWELFSLFYYGALVPNTAFAKLNTGVSRSELLVQGAVYLRDALAWDPPVLLMIGLGLAFACSARRPQVRWLALGIVLYLLYIVRIGGDFMIGRFLTVPLFAAACLVARSESPLEQPGNLAMLLAPFALLLLHPNATERWPVGSMHHDGVADERAYYKDTSSFMMSTRTRAMPSHFWMGEARRAQVEGKKVLVSGNIGILGYYAGPSVHIVDTHALTDPLLARLPVAFDAFWRIGHYARTVPEGYVATLETGECRMKDERLCEYYAALHEVVAGELWSWHRLWMIARLNLGSYDGLVDQERYRFPNRPEVPFEKVAGYVAENAAWNSHGMRAFGNSGLMIRLGYLATGAQGLLASFDGNDSYRIELRRDDVSVGQVTSTSLDLTGTHTRSIPVPADVTREGFDSIVVLPIAGDSSYSIGFIRLTL